LNLLNVVTSCLIATCSEVFVVYADGVNAPTSVGDENWNSPIRNMFFQEHYNLQLKCAEVDPIGSVG